ncbi:MAG: hypothetical protein WA005_04665 [Candidatus Binataceae bacterium]
MAVNKSLPLTLTPKRVRRKRVSVPLANVHAASLNGASTYEPISSVWEGSDGDLLEAMFNFYATIPPEPILDATYNAGRFWKGSKRRVVSMDIDPKYKPMIVGDNRKMTGVPAAKFGTVIYDPPPCWAARTGQEPETIRRGLRSDGGVRQGSRLEFELSVSAISEASQESAKARWLAAREDHRHGEQPQIEVAAL